MNGFSPPAWGWSLPTALMAGDTLVLPTRVGMVRPVLEWDGTHGSSPHPRGDGPLTLRIW